MSPEPPKRGAGYQGTAVRFRSRCRPDRQSSSSVGHRREHVKLANLVQREGQPLHLGKARSLALLQDPVQDRSHQVRREAGTGEQLRIRGRLHLLKSLPVPGGAEAAWQFYAATGAPTPVAAFLYPAAACDSRFGGRAGPRRHGIRAAFRVRPGGSWQQAPFGRLRMHNKRPVPPRAWPEEGGRRLDVDQAVVSRALVSD